MSSADLLEDGFPHGTPAGYQLGCRGSHCAGIEEFGWSCTYAVQQYRGDFAWRRWVQEGKTPTEIKVLRKGPVVESTPKNVEFRITPTVTMADSREPVRHAPKPRPSGQWFVSRKAPGVWRAIGGDRARGRLFASQQEAFTWALAQATPKVSPATIPHAKPVAEKRAYVRMTAEQLAQAVGMHKAGEKSWAVIAKTVGAKQQTIRMAVLKALSKEQAA